MVQAPIPNPYNGMRQQRQQRQQYRYQGDHTTEHAANGVGETLTRRPPMTIAKALREHCNIPCKAYFLCVVTDEGLPHYFSGPMLQGPNDDAVRQLFDEEGFMRLQNLPPAPASFPDRSASSLRDGLISAFEEPWQQQQQFQQSRGADRSQWTAGGRRYSNYDDFGEEVGGTGRRKRPRAAPARVQRVDDEPQALTTAVKRPLRIGSSKEVEDFYAQRFKNCQQTACKIIAKAWVKAVEPKKQSHHPYTGEDQKAPDWWPKPWGPSHTERVRHKEPDHLLKRERVPLLIHILRMVIEPNHQQHAAIQNLRLDVAKLEEVTTEALSSFFADKENPANAKKKPYLKEIFAVAKREARYRDGAIDADDVIYVASDDRIPEQYVSDDELIQTKEEEETQPPSARISPQRTSVPASQNSQNTMISTPSTVANSPVGNMTGGNMTGGSFLEEFKELPVRQAPPYAPSMMHPDMGTNQHHYVDAGNMAVGGQPPALQTQGNIGMTDMMANPHDQSRRAPMFNSSADFQSPPGSGLYSPAGWTAGTTAPQNSSLYAPYSQAPAPQQQPAASYVAPSNVQSFMENSFDGMPRPYDSSHGNMYRGGGNVNQPPLAPPSMAQPPMTQSHGYAHYMAHDNQGLANGLPKMDPHMSRDQRH